MLQSWIFDSPKRTATACYLDIHQAFQVHSTVSKKCFFLLICFYRPWWITASSFLTNERRRIHSSWVVPSCPRGGHFCHIQSPGVRCQGICGTPSIGNSEGSRHGNSTGIRLVTALQLESVFSNFESPEVISEDGNGDSLLHSSAKS